MGASLAWLQLDPRQLFREQQRSDCKLGVPAYVLKRNLKTPKGTKEASWTMFLPSQWCCKERKGQRSTAHWRRWMTSAFLSSHQAGSGVTTIDKPLRCFVDTLQALPVHTISFAPFFLHLSGIGLDSTAAFFLSFFFFSGLFGYRGIMSFSAQV